MNDSDTLAPQYFEAIGKVVVAFQSLEESVTFGLIRLTRHNPEEDIDLDYVLALSEMPFKGRTKLMRNHLERVKPEKFLYPTSPHPDKRPEFIRELIDKLKTSTAACDKMEEERNQYMHSIWSSSGNEGELVARRYKLRVQPKKTTVTDEEVPLQKILDLVVRMRDCREMISTCTEFLASVLIDKRSAAN